MIDEDNLLTIIAIVCMMLLFIFSIYGFYKSIFGNYESNKTTNIEPRLTYHLCNNETLYMYDDKRVVIERTP